jgi:hypothetical protein
MFNRRGGFALVPPSATGPEGGPGKRKFFVRVPFMFGQGSKAILDLDRRLVDLGGGTGASRDDVLQEGLDFAHVVGEGAVLAGFKEGLGMCNGDGIIKSGSGPLTNGEFAGFSNFATNQSVVTIEVGGIIDLAANVKGGAAEDIVEDLRTGLVL